MLVQCTGVRKWYKADTSDAQKYNQRIKKYDDVVLPLCSGTSLNQVNPVISE